MVGDVFLRDILLTFRNMCTQAAAGEQPIPYVYANYNVEIFASPHNQHVRSFLAHMVNAFAKSLNEYDDKKPPHLPRYILIIMDKDLIENAQVYDFGVSHTFEDLMKWLLINFNNMIEIRKDLIKKRPSAVSSSSEPRLIWVQMIKRSESMDKHIFSLTWKFNTIMESVIAGDKRSHILKPFLEGTNANFDIFGNLTLAGKVAYWKMIDETMKDFDTEETELEPMKTNFTKKKPSAHHTKTYSQGHGNQCKSSYDRFHWFNKSKSWRN